MNFMECMVNAWKGREETHMFTFLLGDHVVARSFAQELAQLQHFAQAYRLRGVNSGDIVVIILGFRPELVAAFLGALWIGAIPSFLPEPSEKQDLNYYAESHAQLLRHLGAKLLVTDQAAAAERIAACGSFSVPVWNIDSLAPAANSRLKTADSATPHDSPRGFDPQLPAARPDLSPAQPPADAIAFLQHSSGTTALKKSVALTHRQVLAQVAGYQRALGMQPGETIVSWLPIYHDMGLIACFLLPMLCGAHVVMMSPFAWVRKPAMLLDAIESYRCDYCWLPNFAFNLLAIARPPKRSWSLGHALQGRYVSSLRRRLCRFRRSSGPASGLLRHGGDGLRRHADKIGRSRPSSLDRRARICRPLSSGSLRRSRGSRVPSCWLND